MGLFRSLMMASTLPYKRRLSWLRSTGTQYIDTGITPNQDTRIELRYQVNNLTAPLFRVFGAYDGTNQLALYRATGGDVLTATRGITGTFRSYCSFTGYHTVIVSNDSVYQDGVLLENDGTKTNSWSVGYSIFLFTQNHQGSPSSVAQFLVGDIYYCRIWQGNVFVRDVLPVLWGAGKPYVDGNTGASVIPAADKPGMYDTVTGRLFVNKGSNEFSYE